MASHKRKISKIRYPLLLPRQLTCPLKRVLPELTLSKVAYRLSAAVLSYPTRKTKGATATITGKTTASTIKANHNGNLGEPILLTNFVHYLSGVPPTPANKASLSNYRKSTIVPKFQTEPCHCKGTLTPPKKN